MRNRLRPLELSLWVICVGELLILIALHLWSWANGLIWERNVGYYLSIVSKYFIYVIIFAGLFYFIYSIVSILREAKNDTDPLRFLEKSAIKNFLKDIGREIIEALRVFTPPTLALILTTEIIAFGNTVNMPRLKDILVLSWDKALTGTLPFIFWSGKLFPPWFFKAVIFSFNWLPIALIIFAMFLFGARKRLLYEFLLAFTLVNALLIPLWNIVPVLSPQDRFVDNVYHLDVPESVATGLLEFNPKGELAVFLLDIRLRKEESFPHGGNPTSTIPSAHAAWAALLAYYVYRYSKLLFIPIFVFALLSTLGTFLLLQHYFVDAPLGVLIAIPAIWITSFISHRYKNHTGA